MKTQHFWTLGHNEDAFNRQVYSTKDILRFEQKQWKFFSNLTAHMKALEQTEERIMKSSRWLEIIKLRTEINIIETATK